MTVLAFTVVVTICLHILAVNQFQLVSLMLVQRSVCVLDVYGTDSFVTVLKLPTFIKYAPVSKIKGLSRT